MRKDKCHLLFTLISLLMILIIGLGSKFYVGWGDKWVNNSLGGVWYEIFWCLLFWLFFPSKINIVRIPIGVFIVTFLLEFLQLWHSPFLESIRSSLLGKLLLGTTFSWPDFPYYFIGSLLGMIWLSQLWDFTRKS